MSSQRSDPNKLHPVKFHHFGFSFNQHNYCSTCIEAEKGDDPCVTGLSTKKQDKGRGRGDFQESKTGLKGEN